MNTGTKVLDVTRKLVWGLTGLSIMSCLIRNDYNVIFSFFILIILNRFFMENTKFYTKIIVHILLVLIVADVLWLIIMMPIWNQNIKNDYWESISGMHSFVLFLAFMELFLKAAIAGYLVIDYKNKNPDDIKDLTSFNYSMNQNIQANPRGVSANININSNQNFQNPY